MARARKSHRHDEEIAKTRRGELKPVRGQPGDNPYVIYVSYSRADLEIPKVLVLNFKAEYAARFFLDQLIGEDEWEWTESVGSRHCILTATGLKIGMFSKTDFKMLLDYNLSEKEAEWHDTQIEKAVKALKYGLTEEDLASKRRRYRSEDEEDTDEDTGTPDKPKREKKPPKEKKAKVDKTGLVSANDIATELKVEGREVRGVLRSLKLEKPEHGWAWDKKTAEDIKTKVIKGLKEAKKKK